MHVEEVAEALEQMVELKNLGGGFVRKNKLSERSKEISNKTLALVTQMQPLSDESSWCSRALGRIVETVNTWSKPFCCWFCSIATAATQKSHKKT